MAFDPELATRAYMATLTGAARARSDAYFEGGYWLLLWDFAVTLLVNGALLHFGIAARLSAAVGRFTTRPALRALMFAFVFILAVTVLSLPWTIWTGFVREHAYGLSNQGFGEWLGEATLQALIAAVITALLWTGIHAALRRSPRGWWLAGTGITVAGLIIGITLAPVFIEPLFNRYTPLPDGPVRQAVLSMARANGVPADNVLLVDASRQSSRISANVAGLFGTTRIALNDNLLKQGSDEVRAVMGHELGHYVLNHGPKMIIAFTLIFALAFLVLARAVPALLARIGGRWGVESLDDPAILPVASIVFAAVWLALTPAINTLIRTQEQEADVFGLNAARTPDAFARIAMKLSQYRKIEPGPLEEALFFDHPSGHTRVLTAMRWKAEHLGQSDVR